MKIQQNCIGLGVMLIQGMIGASKGAAQRWVHEDGAHDVEYTQTEAAVGGMHIPPATRGSVGETFEEKYEKYLLEGCLKRVKDYLEAVDKEFKIK